MKEVLKLEDLLPLIEEALSAGAPFTFFPRGGSMMPMLRQGLDRAEIVSKKKRAPKKGEVILYRRKNGDFILHRIIKENKDGNFTTCGDAQLMPEYGVKAESIIAVLSGFFREDVYISADNKKYKSYVKKQMLLRYPKRLKSIIKKL